MAWRKIEGHEGAMAACINSDREMFLSWAQRNGATMFDGIDIWNEDVPYIIKNGGRCVARTKLTANPGFDKANNWLDHPRLYKNPKTGQVWLVSHIYDNRPETLCGLMEWCAENDFVVSFLYSSWYNPDEALGVEITSREAYERGKK